MNGFATPARGFSTTLLLVASCLFSCNGSSGPFEGDRAYAHTAQIVGFGPRPAGSEALRKTADYIGEQLRTLGLTPREQTWEQEVTAYGKTRKLQLRNVWTEIPGKDPKGPVLLIGAHYDSKICTGHPDPAHNFEFVGANDAAGSCGILLELARVLQTRDNTPNIWLLWIDGEESQEFVWKGDTALLGSTHFVRTMSKDKNYFPNGFSERLKVMVLLDLLGDPNLKIDKDSKSDETLLEIFGKAAEQMGAEDKMFQYLSPMEDDHIPFKNFGVAPIDLIDFRWRYANDQARSGETAPAEGTYTAWWHTEQDNLSNVSADSLGFVGNLVWHALPEIEKAFYSK